MTKNSLLVLLTCTVCWLMGTTSWGQDPFEDPADLGQPAVGIDNAQPPGDADAEPAEENLDDPVVQAILESNPATPLELTRAAQTLLDLGYPEQSRKFIKQLLAANIPPAELAALQKKFGSALFLRIARDKRIAPEGGQFANSVLDAGARAARDPQRIKNLISRLGDPDRAVRYAAQVDLRDAGTSAVTELIRVLADPLRTAEHAAVKDTLIDLNEDAIGPLLGVIGGPREDRLLVQAMTVLGRIGTKRAIPFLVGAYGSPDSSPQLKRAAGAALLRLLGETPAEYDARRYLRRKTLSYLQGNFDSRPAEDGTIVVWVWNDRAQTVAPRRVPQSDASLIEAARTARELFRLDPENKEYRRLYLAANLAANKTVYGFNRPLPFERSAFLRRAKQIEPAVMIDVLEWSLDHEQRAAAMAAAEVLGQMGDKIALQSKQGMPSVLIRAVENKDPYVRFAALQAILTLDPTRPYAGSSRVTEALAYFVNSMAERRIRIASSRADYAGSLAGTLTQLGFQTDIAATGRGLIRKATKSPDYEFIIMTEFLTKPAAGETLQILRYDHRTAKIPVAVLTNSDTPDLTPFSNSDDPLTVVYPPPQSLETAKDLIRRLESVPVGRRASVEHRAWQASEALAWIAMLAEQPRRYPFYDLFRTQLSAERALATPALAPRAAKVLGLLATPQAQQALVDVASQNARSVKDRKAAVEGFRVATGRRGILLTTDQIRRQYDRYNNSARLDVDSQTILGEILDILEEPTKRQAQGDRQEKDPDGRATG